MSQCLCFLFNIVYTCNSAHEEEKSCMDMFAFMHSLDTKVSYKYEVVGAGQASPQAVGSPMAAALPMSHLL